MVSLGGDLRWYDAGWRGALHDPEGPEGLNQSSDEHYSGSSQNGLAWKLNGGC